MTTLKLKKPIDTIKKYKCELCNRDDGVDDADVKYFYHDSLMLCESCITDMDKSEMYDKSSIELYLDGTVLTNGSNTFSVIINDFKKSENKIFGVRYDIWFEFNGKSWHGVKMGNDYYNAVKCKVKKV
jgi:hypothetical protein